MRRRNRRRRDRTCGSASTRSSATLAARAERCFPARRRTGVATPRVHRERGRRGPLARSSPLACQAARRTTPTGSARRHIGAGTIARTTRTRCGGTAASSRNRASRGSPPRSRCRSRTPTIAPGRPRTATRASPSSRRCSARRYDGSALGAMASCNPVRMLTTYAGARRAERAVERESRLRRAERAPRAEAGTGVARHRFDRAGEGAGAASDGAVDDDAHCRTARQGSTRLESPAA